MTSKGSRGDDKVASESGCHQERVGEVARHEAVVMKGYAHDSQGL